MAKARAYVCDSLDDPENMLAHYFGTNIHRGAKPAKPKRRLTKARPTPVVPMEMKDPHMRAAYLLGELEGDFSPPAHEPKHVVHKTLISPEVLDAWEEESGESNGGPVKVHLQELVRHNGMAKYLPFDRTARTFFRDLARLMPNMGHALAWLRRYLEYHQMGLKFAYFKPILLVGAPGTGKSLLAEAVGRALRVPVVRVACGNAESSFHLVGSDSVWRASHPGEIAMNLLRHRVGNMLVILDEVEKLFLRDGGTAPPQHVLYDLLEPQSMKAFQDQYLKFPMRAEHLMFIATANNVRGLPGPIRNRLEIVPVPPVKAEDLVRILRAIYKMRARREPFSWSSRVSTEALRLLVENSNGSVRKAARLLEKAMVLALEENAKRPRLGKRLVQQVVEEVREQERLAAEVEKERTDSPRVGFV